jgi:serine/threonine protein kinase/Flp pilus assembly protein TadD
MIGKTISHYRIIEKLGEGGMGVVYEAEDTKLKRTVALKFLPLHFSADDEAKQRFIHEAQAASALNHTNICSIHTIEEFEGQQFIDMEFVEGKTLGVLLKEKELSLREAVDIAFQVAEGLNAAHKRGIVHRDIKPDNIMVTDEGLVKVMDFGLAKLKGSSKLTRVHSTLGTVSYMSPEQARGEEVDQRSDIFSLGAVLYEMIAGRRPFAGEHEAAIIYSLVNETPEPLARYKSDVPYDLQRVVDKALAKEKDKRYQHVDEMAADLRSAVPHVSREVPTVARRSRVPWLIVACVVVLAAAGMYLFYPKSVPTSANGRSIAVLPFKNLSDSKEDEYFSDGITDDIIAQLSKIAQLKVISRTSIMQYKGMSKNVREIGKELDVGTILEGSVRRAGNQVRIVAQLIDAKNEGHLWADTYDEEMTQVFAIQSDVAQKIAAALKAKLSPGEKERIEKKQTEDAEAYQLYLKGRFYWNKRRGDDLKTAIDYFNQAIAEDSSYAMAYAGLASAYETLPQYSLLPPKEVMPKAEAAARRALEIDPALAEAHAVLGDFKMSYEFDWAGADSEFKRAVELDPSYPTAHHWYSIRLLVFGRFDEALAEIKRAQELDPISLIINTTIADILFEMRQYDKSIDQSKKTLELDPNFAFAHSLLGWAYLQQGRFDEAIAEYQKVRTIVGSGPYGLADLGYAYGRTGKKGDAAQILSDLLQFSKQGYSLPYDIALVYWGLGDNNQTLEWLERAYQERSTFVMWLKIDPTWDGLRSDERFIALLKKMGLEE